MVVEALADLKGRVAPVTGATEQRLPAAGPLVSLVPGGGLRRGSVVGLAGPGATTLLWALLGPPTAGGSWAVLVGMPGVGLAAAAEAGVALDRLAVVADPGGSWTTVVAALLDGFDLVVVAPDGRTRPADARRLAARARERGAVVVLAGGWDRAWPEGPDLCLTVADPEWEGLGQGHGHLRRRRARVSATGRREAARPRSAPLWLPAGPGRPVVEAHEDHEADEDPEVLLAPDLSEVLPAADPSRVLGRAATGPEATVREATVREAS